MKFAFFTDYNFYLNIFLFTNKNFERPINERMTKNFFNDPLFAAVGCAKTGKISVADNIAVGKSGEVSFNVKHSLWERLLNKESARLIF